MLSISRGGKPLGEHMSRTVGVDGSKYRRLVRSGIR